MFLFYSKTEEINQKDYDLVLRISKYVRNKEELFNIFSSELHFPSYFGETWDSFYDCLCNLDYLNKSKILFLHEELPFKDSDADRTIYLDILSDVETNVLKDNVYKITTAFPEKYRDLIGSKE